MKRRTIIKVLMAGLIFLSACQKNTDIFVPDPGQLNGPDTAWYSSITPTMPVSILKINILIAPQQDTLITGSNTTTIITQSGLQLTFPPNFCIGAGGTAITGKINIQAMLVKSKGDMVRLNKPTTSSNRLLVTAGELFISLNKDGQELQLAPGVRYNIRYIDNPLNTAMKFFAGDESNTQHFNWLSNPDPANNILTPGSQSYEIYTNRLRWISPAYFYDTAGISRVTVTADLAPYFTNANTVAFTVFKDLRSVVAMQGDINTRKFSTGKLPSGKAVTVVVISKQANDYYLGYETVITLTSTAGDPTQSVLVKPVKKSLADILYYLSTL